MRMKKMKLKVLSCLLLLMCVVWCFPVQAKESYQPVYVRDKNGTVCTGDFDKITSGQIIFYPGEMMNNEDEYPVIVWANGTMCPPALYYELLSEFAEGGYVVVTNTDMMSGDGKAQSASVDYILRENEDPKSIFYHRIAVDQIGAAGHSQGGKSTVNAATSDFRIKSIVSVAGASKSSEAKNLSTPALFLAGTLDTIVLSSLWVKPAYNQCKGPAVYVSLKNGIHTSCSLKPRQYSTYIVKWFDATLKKDEAALAVFKKGGQLSRDSEWKDYQSKGF